MTMMGILMAVPSPTLSQESCLCNTLTRYSISMKSPLNDGGSFKHISLCLSVTLAIRSGISILVGNEPLSFKVGILKDID